MPYSKSVGSSATLLGENLDLSVLHFDFVQLQRPRGVTRRTRGRCRCIRSSSGVAPPVRVVHGQQVQGQGRHPPHRSASNGSSHCAAAATLGASLVSDNVTRIEIKQKAAASLGRLSVRWERATLIPPVAGSLSSTRRMPWRTGSSSRQLATGKLGQTH